MTYIMAKMTKKHKMMAYLLNKDEDFGYSQEEIATLMGVSQGTVSNSVKEISYLLRIKDLENELAQARESLIQQDLLHSPSRFPILKK